MAFTISSILILSIISSGLTPPEGNTPTGRPASDFLAIMREAIFVGDNPERLATPINISGVGTGGAAFEVRNEKSIKFYKDCGLVIEGKLRINSKRREKTVFESFNKKKSQPKFR